MKNNWIAIVSASIATFVMIGACQQAAEKETIESEWLGAGLQEMAENIETQFRGFDMAMVETGYRYKELYWAGTDENWDYARYHTEKLETAIRNGFIRRPAREASATHYLNTALPAMLSAIDGENQDDFFREFTTLTASCNTCHALEDVPFMMVKIPEVRTTVIQR